MLQAPGHKRQQIPPPAVHLLPTGSGHPPGALPGRQKTHPRLGGSQRRRRSRHQSTHPHTAAGPTAGPSQLPRGLGSSIHLKPELRVDGTPVATGPGMGAGSEPVGQGGYTRYGQQDWDETQDPLIAGQQTAIGLSIQGISQAQLQTLKTRMEATKQKLEQAQAAPEAQRPAILQGMTGEHLTGDLLTATIWGYFAALQSHGAIASAQAQMIDRPALSYGLFHAQVKPRKLYGIVTTGIRFQGLNMDIGHLRHTRWVKNDDPSAPINNKPELTANGKTAAQNRWIAYNKMRGQGASAMEHAVPERYWVDKNQCRYVDEFGQIKNPLLVDCAQGISAVKAIAIAQAEGQRIYTINAQNAATALPALTIGGDVGAEIRSAVQAGKEVTVHESPISAHGWMGYGYIITDPETGAGAYIIDGGGNGGFLLAAIVATILVLGGWLSALLVLSLVLEFIIGAITIGINAILQKMLNLDDRAHIQVSFVEIMATFVLLTAALLIGSPILVVGALIGLVGAMLGLLWDIFV